MKLTLFLPLLYLAGNFFSSLPSKVLPFCWIFSLLCFAPALPPGSSYLLLVLSLSVPPATISSCCTPSIIPAPWLSRLCGRRGLQPLGREMQPLSRAGLPGPGLCTPGLTLARSWLASGNSQENLLNFAVSSGDWFLPFYIFSLSCEKLLAKESTFFLLTGSSCLSFL